MAGTVGLAIAAAHPPSRSPQAPGQSRPSGRATGIDYLGSSRPAASGSFSSGSTTATCRRLRRQRERRGGNGMSIDRLRAHWGFSRTPFTKELAPSMLFASSRTPAGGREDRLDRAGARARRGLRRGRRRQNGRRPRRDRRAGSEPAHDDLPPQPGDRRARDLHAEIVRALGATPPVLHGAADRPSPELLETEEAERGRRVVLVLDESHLLTPSSSSSCGC